MRSIARLQCLLALISAAALVVSAVGAADGRKMGEELQLALEPRHMTSTIERCFLGA